MLILCWFVELQWKFQLKQVYYCAKWEEPCWLGRTLSICCRKPEGHTVASHLATTSRATPRRGPMARKQFSQSPPCFEEKPSHLSWPQLCFSQVCEEAHIADGTKLMQVLVILESLQREIFWQSYSVHYSSKRGNTHVVICRNIVSPPCSLPGCLIYLDKCQLRSGLSAIRCV